MKDEKLIKKLSEEIKINEIKEKFFRIENQADELVKNLDDINVNESNKNVLKTKTELRSVAMEASNQREALEKLYQDILEAEKGRLDALKEIGRQKEILTEANNSGDVKESALKIINEKEGMKLDLYIALLEYEERFNSFKTSALFEVENKLLNVKSDANQLISAHQGQTTKSRSASPAAIKPPTNNNGAIRPGGGMDRQ